MTSQHGKAKRWQLAIPLGCLGAVLITAAIIAVTALAVAPTPISPSDALRISEGMTEHEVRAILGDPHDFHSGAWVYKSDQLGINGPFFVEFDEDGRVRHTSWL